VVSRSASGLVSAVAWRVCAFPGLAGTLSRRAGASLWLAGAFCGLAVPSSRRSCRSGGCSAGAQIRGQLVAGWHGQRRARAAPRCPAVSRLVLSPRSPSTRGWPEAAPSEPPLPGGAPRTAVALAALLAPAAHAHGPHPARAGAGILAA